MRLLRLLLAISSMTGIADGQGVLLNAGDTWTYHFTTLDYVSTQSGSTAPFGATFSFAYGVNAYPANLLYEAFEGLAPEGFLGSGTQPIGGMGILLPTSAWQDLEGSVRFTVTDGSFDIESLTFTVWRPSATTPLSFDTFQTTVTLVPEPSTWAVWLCGCSLLWLCEGGRPVANKSLQATRVGAGSSAVAVHVFRSRVPELCRWLLRPVTTRTRLSVVALVGLLLCGCRATPEKDQAQEFPRQSALPAPCVAVDDAEMNAAMQTARSKFSEFWSEVSADRRRAKPVLELAIIKAHFSDTGTPSNQEMMWLDNVEFDGTTISGHLLNEPIHVHSLRKGQRVSFPLDQLGDWFYVRDGRAVGGFTERLLRSRLSEEQRRVYDSEHAYRFE